MATLHYRSSQLNPQWIDVDKRSIAIAFSSETPVQRKFGEEILDHNPNAIRLTRLQDGGPVLIDHDPTQQIGIVESVSIEPDGVGRAFIRIGKSTRAQQEWQDIQDGIRRHISVGYQVHQMHEEDNNRYRVTDWEPLEISFVAMPADISVGVGRQVETENEQAEEKSQVENKMIESPEININEIQTEARQSELQRIREITQIGQQFNCSDLATTAINQGDSLDNFRNQVLQNLKNSTKTKASTQSPATELGLSNKEIKDYSLLRAIQAFVHNDWKTAGLEREASIAISEKLNREPRGFFVPFELQTRLQQVKQPKDGGYLVATELLSQSFIDILRNTSALTGLGATMLTNLTGNIDIPKQIGSSQFIWIDENENSNETALEFGQISLSPKTITGSVPITRRLLKQSSLDIEQLVRRDLAIGAALAIDLAALTGSGKKNEPLGILNIPDISHNPYLDKPSFEEVVSLETQVNSVNALLGHLAYLGNAKMTGMLKTTEQATHTGQFLLNNDRLNGYHYQASNQVPDETLIFGDFSSIIIGLWGVLDIMPDTATYAKSAGLVIRVFQDIDIAIRHSESFAVLDKVEETN